MKTTVKYIGIESVNYYFDKAEVMEALIREHEIDVPKGATLEFDLFENAEDDPEHAELLIKYEAK